MKYLKCRFTYGQYLDPETRLKIGRGQIVPVNNVTTNMKQFLLKKGLIEVSQAEYEAWKGAQQEIIPPTSVILEEQKEAEEKPVEDVLPKQEVSAPVGVVSAPQSSDKTKKLAEKFKKSPSSKE